MPERTLLCFDYGTKNIGIAVGQTVTGTATGILTVKSRKNRPDWETITGVIEEWAPDELVVGYPLGMDDSKQEMTRAVEKFKNRLSARYGLPVHLVDERLSSYEAKERLKSDDGLDSMAAQVILESYFHDHANGTS